MKLKTIVLACGLFLAGGALAFGAESPAADVKTQLKAEGANLSLLGEGAMAKVGYYMPQRLELSATKPAELKKAPDSQSLLYGKIKFCGVEHLIVLDEPDGADAKLYVDTNGNGDVTDDPPAEWAKRTYNKTMTQWMGGFKLPMAKDEKAPLARLAAYRFDKNDAGRAALKNVLLYYRDYALVGDVTLGQKKYPAMLVENRSTGDFSAASALLIDRNNDGRFDARSESFAIGKPFNIDGNVWKVDQVSADGKFKIEPSNETVAEIKPPPDNGVGQKITAFKAKKMDGQEVNFPGDYKGKIVMLDFWATWCGPCMAEVPGLAKAYAEFHPKGIEILGISLDQPKAEAKVKEVTAANKMTWPQVYDGKGWQAEIAQLYGINSIPAAFLVDGDTGQVLAAGESLRGPELEKTFKAALEKKEKK